MLSCAHHILLAPTQCRKVFGSGRQDLRLGGGGTSKGGVAKLVQVSPSHAIHFWGPETEFVGFTHFYKIGKPLYHNGRVGIAASRGSQYETVYWKTFQLTNIPVDKHKVMHWIHLGLEPLTGLKFIGIALYSRCYSLIMAVRGRVKDKADLQKCCMHKLSCSILN